MASTHVRPAGPIVASSASTVAVVPAAAPIMHATPSQSLHQHQHHQPYYLQPPPQFLINPAILHEYATVIAQAIEADRGEAHLEHIINDYAGSLQQRLLAELQAWKKLVAERHGVELFDDTTPPRGKGKGSKHPRDSDSEGEDGTEDEESGRGNWRCLFYEHDPTEYPTCTKRYKRVSELRRHIKTHTLPHYCEQCGYRTAEARRLENHRCEESNRTRYSPVTPEEKEQHQKLMRMGVGVGEMRKILFGSASEIADRKRRKGEHSPEHETTPPIEVTDEDANILTPENGIVYSNHSGYSSAHHSRTPSMTLASTSGAPTPFQNQTPFPHPMPFTTADLVPFTAVSPPRLLPFDPDRPDLPIVHSPTTVSQAGEAWGYYGAEYISPNMGLSEGSSASPYSNHVSPPVHTDGSDLHNYLETIFDKDELVGSRSLPTEVRKLRPSLFSKMRQSFSSNRSLKQQQTVREAPLIEEETKTPGQAAGERKAEKGEDGAVAKKKETISGGNLESPESPGADPPIKKEASPDSIADENATASTDNPVHQEAEEITPKDNGGESVAPSRADQPSKVIEVRPPAPEHVPSSQTRTPNGKLAMLCAQVVARFLGQKRNRNRPASTEPTT